MLTRSGTEGKKLLSILLTMSYGRDENQVMMSGICKDSEIGLEACNYEFEVEWEKMSLASNLEKDAFGLNEAKQKENIENRLLNFILEDKADFQEDDIVRDLSRVRPMLLWA